MAEMVKSVEYIEITSTTTTASGILSKGQNTANCVPFATGHRDGADDMRQGYADVYFGTDGVTGSGIVNVEFAYVDGTNKVDRIFVVEFDPAEVKVQQGTFSMVSTTTDSPTISGVDTDHTAMVHYYNTSDITNNWDYHSVRGYFSSSTQAEFKRYTGIGTIYGHYYIFEALNNQFSVQSKTWTHSVATASTQEIDCVPWHKSFILCSHYSYNVTSYSSRGTCRVFLQSQTTLGIDKYSASGSIYAHCFVVTFNDNKKYVQRGFVNFEATDTVLNYDLGHEVDLDYAMVTTAKVPSIIKTNGTAAATVEASFVSTEFNTTSGIKIERNSTGSVTASAQYEIIDWRGETMISGSNQSPLDPNLSCVKSVESFNLDIDEWYKEYELTKDQDVSNCVPFVSTRGDSVSGYQGALMTNVWFSEINLVSAQRKSETGITKVYINVVEFYPDQVKVQQGNARIDYGSNEALVTVSGVDQSKAALLFNSNTYNSTLTTIFDYHMIRGKFNSNTQLQFYRYNNANITDINYYIFEDLVGNFEAESVQETMTVATSFSVIADLHLKYNNTFFLYSYYTYNCTSYSSRATCRARLLGTHNVVIDKYNSSGDIYLSVFFIKFTDDRRHVDYYTSSLSSDTPDITNVDSIFIDNEDSLMVFCPNCNTTGRVNTTATADISEMCASVELTTSGTVLQMQSQRDGGALVGDYSFIFIDWVGYKPTLQQITDTTSFVRSVTHKEISMDSTMVESTYLLDGQIPENCVPFVTQKGMDTGGYQYNLMPIVIIYNDDSNQINIHRGNATGTLDVSIYVVEFDPSQVKVQRGSFFIDGTSVTKTIESVNLDKAFVMGSYCCDSSAVGWHHHLVQTKFNSSTEVSITRYDSTGNIYGYYYVVEALDDQFRVQSVDFPGGSSAVDIYGEFTEFRPGLNRTIFIGSYTHRAVSSYPQRSTYRMFTRVDDLIQMNKASATDICDSAHVFVVEFNKDLGVRMLTGFSDLTVGITSTTYSFLSETPAFGVDRSMVCNLLTNNISRGDGSSTAIHKENLFHKMELTNSGTKVTVDRYSTESNTYSFWQVIEFPPFKTHYFEGVIQEEGEEVSGRYVRAYRADTGELMNSTTSASGTGSYHLETTYSGTHYITCQDDSGGEDYNDLILGKMIPDEIT